MFKRVLAPVIEIAGATGILISSRLQVIGCNRGIKGMVAWPGE